MNASDYQRINALFERLADEPDSRWHEVLDQERNSDIVARVLAMLKSDRADGDGIQESIAQASGLLDTDPRQVGPFRILRLVGEGGMGRVYEAIRDDRDFEQRVALKVLRIAGSSPIFVDRLRVEQQVLARLNHPHIACMLDGGELADGTPFVAMEFVPGQPLTEYVESQDLELSACLTLFGQLCEAVSYAHQNLVVHRDLKPDNVMVDERGNVKLLDFGIAKLLGPDIQAVGTLTRAGAMSPAYAAPEQITGEGISTLTDVYALGVVLFQLLTGKLPFDVSDSSSALELERKICETDPEKPSAVTRRIRESNLKGDLDTIILKCLAKQPQRRYESVRALMDDLSRYREGKPVAARPDSFAYRAGKFLRRNALATGFSTVLIITLLASAIIAHWQSRQIAQQRDLAEREAVAAQQVADFMLDLFRVSDPRERGPKDLTARDLLDRASASVTEEVDAAPLIKARLMHVLGLAYSNMGDYEQGISLLNQALELRRQHAGAGSPEVSDSLNRIGNVHRVYDRLDLAEEPLMQALAMREAGERDAELADAYNNVGLLQYQLGHLAKAESLLRQSIALHTKLTSANDRSVVSPHHNLALTLRQMGRYEESREAIAVKLRINEAEGGDESASYANSLAVMGRIERELGNFSSARTYSDRSLELRRSIYSQGHPGLVAGLEGAALIAMDFGEFDRAQALLDEALPLAVEGSGPNSNSAARVHIAKAVTLWRMGERAQALREAKRSEEIRATQMQPNNPSLWESRIVVATMLAESDPAESLRIIESVEPHMAKTLPTDHPDRQHVRLIKALVENDTSALELLVDVPEKAGFRVRRIAAHARLHVGDKDAVDHAASQYPDLSHTTIRSLL